MKTDGGWISVTEAARLYRKCRKWVYDQIDKYEIETRKENNRKMLRLVDLIAHRGEPSNGAPSNTATYTEHSQKITPDPTAELTPESTQTELLKQENQFLQHRIQELEADRSARQTREARWDEERTRLVGIIDRQTLALPKPEGRGVFSRLLGWLNS